VAVHVEPAERYEPAPDVGIVTCYFNANGYRTRRANYERFAEPILRSGLRLLTVECAFPGAPFALPPAPGLLRVGGRDVMWQKERLLNLAIATLPATCTKVVWLDCDVLFENPAWAVETSRRLERRAVVQPYDRAVRLPRGTAAYRGAGDVWEGFGATVARRPDLLLSARFDRHGHTGFAWAARREVVARHGLYDACIAGSGDHMMAHAFCGDWDSPCIDRIIGAANRHREWFVAWSRRLYPAVRARVGHVAGTILHLWHGEVADRRYVDRNRELAAFDFDPATDLRVGATGCWEWASGKSALHRWAVAYFGQRREDGEPDGEGGDDDTRRSAPAGGDRDAPRAAV
jgi:hypothetical protein